jgi:hypothetical protein
MMMSVRWIAVLATVMTAMSAALFAQSGPSAPSADARAGAEQLFERYVALGRAFDPAVADLYADNAVITNKRTYPTGQVREMTIPAVKYKELIRRAMPLARQRGDRNVYSDCQYTPEGTRVRIACTRYSQLKKYSSPISLLVGPGQAGDWLIFEERSESRP